MGNCMRISAIKKCEKSNGVAGPSHGGSRRRGFRCNVHGAGPRDRCFEQLLSLPPPEPRQRVETGAAWSWRGGRDDPGRRHRGKRRGPEGEGGTQGGGKTRPIAPLIHSAESAYDALMATTKRTRNASGAGASHSKRRVGASTRRAGASTRSNSKKTPGPKKTPKKRAAPGPSRSTAKSIPTRATSKRRTKGRAARDPKPVARGANKASARTANKAPTRTANKAPARTANKALARVGTRTTKGIGTGTAKEKRSIVAHQKGAAASAAGRRQSDVRRRDGAGHIDPDYAADLLAQGGTSDRDENRSGFIEQSRSGDDLAENLGEEFVASATSGENQEEDVLDQEVPEERGGPFVESTAGAEFGWGTDASNPKDAKREPFPTT